MTSTASDPNVVDSTESNPSSGDGGSDCNHGNNNNDDGDGTKNSINNPHHPRCGDLSGGGHGGTSNETTNTPMSGADKPMIPTSAATTTATITVPSPRQEPQQHRAEVWVTGMTCTMCAQTVESAIRSAMTESDQIISLSVNMASDLAQIVWTGDCTVSRIQDAIEGVGFVVERMNPLEERRISLPLSNGPDEPQQQPQNLTAGGVNGEESPQDRWQRIEQRQTRKLQQRRNAFLWSALGTVPILLLTMTPLGSMIHLPPVAGRYAGLSVLILLLCTPVQFIAGWEFYRGAYYGLKSLRTGMDLLIAVGTSASYIYALTGLLRGDDHAVHFFETSAVLICFVLAGKWLQALAVRRTSQALERLLQLQAPTAIRVYPMEDPGHETWQEETIEASQLQPGDWCSILRGGIIPADGMIVYGELTVDESMVTGESVPTYKARGATVLGGTVCVETGSRGACLLQVTATGADTALSKIVQLVSEAQNRQVPIQSFADAVSAVFVPTVCVLSVITFLGWYGACLVDIVPPEWYVHDKTKVTFALLFALSVLVISCPCALGLATPTAVMVGTGVSAQQGVLWKGGGPALEVASQLQVVVFDKTGTLTVGKPVVSDLLKLSSAETKDEEDRFFWLLGSLERSSEHPMASAIVSFCQKRLGDKMQTMSFIPPTNFLACTGRGASGMVDGVTVAVGNRSFCRSMNFEISFVAEECMVSLEEDGKTAILVMIDGEVVAVLGISDHVKPDAKQAITYLRETLRLDVWMVTGDNHRTANAVRVMLGLEEDRVVAEAMPAAKLDHVLRLQQQGLIVAMVGDGVNDSPALAQANVGMSLGTGTDIANEAADVVLVKGEVSDVCKAIDLSRVIVTRIKWNLMFSVLYNLLGIPIAAGVLYPFVQVRLPPTVAAVAMAASSISVVLSSLTLRLYKPPKIAQPPSGRSHRRQQRSGGRQRRRDELRRRLLDHDYHLENSEVTDSTEPVDNRSSQQRCDSTV